MVQTAENSIDYIIDTVACVHPLDPYLRTLKTNGKLILVGIPEQPLQLSANSVIFGGLSAIFTLHVVECV